MKQTLYVAFCGAIAVSVGTFFSVAGKVPGNPLKTRLYRRFCIIDYLCTSPLPGADDPVLERKAVGSTFDSFAHFDTGQSRRTEYQVQVNKQNSTSRPPRMRFAGESKKST